MLRGVNHPSEVTKSPNRNPASGVADRDSATTWSKTSKIRWHRTPGGPTGQDLGDFATWVAYSGAEWQAPEVVATYLRTLEDGGAAYATISRRLTSIHKLVAIAAIAAGDLDYEDPTKHPRVGVTLQAIRRRLSTDQDQANPLTSQRLPAGPSCRSTPPPSRGCATWRCCWSAGTGRCAAPSSPGSDATTSHWRGDGLVLQLPRSKASPDHSVWVPIANQPDSDWNPTTRSKIGSRRRLDSDRPPPRRSGCT